MKTLILIFALILFSCEKEDVSPKIDSIEDCECDRVVSVDQFNLPDGSSFGNYSTVNDCTNQTKDLQWNTNNGESKPIVGSCK
jgi:hypothetical protein